MWLYQTFFRELNHKSMCDIQCIKLHVSRTCAHTCFCVFTVVLFCILVNGVYLDICVANSRWACGSFSMADIGNHLIYIHFFGFLVFLAKSPLKNVARTTFSVAIRFQRTALVYIMEDVFYLHIYPTWCKTDIVRWRSHMKLVLLRFLTIN